MHRFSLALLFGICFTLLSSPSTAQTYSVTDLGTLGGSFSSPSAINNSGQIAGYASLAGDETNHGFLYSGGVITDLGTLGGSYSAAWAMNDSGQIAGHSYIAG